MTPTAATGGKRQRQALWRNDEKKGGKTGLFTAAGKKGDQYIDKGKKHPPVMKGKEGGSSRNGNRRKVSEEKVEGKNAERERKETGGGDKEIRG